MKSKKIIEKVEKYLSSEQHDIALTDLVEKLSNEAYEKIMTTANYNFSISHQKFSQYLDLHHDAVSLLIDIAILVVRWGKTQHIDMLENTLVKLCVIPDEPNEVWRTSTKYVHGLGAILLLNTIGIAAVKYEKYSELDRILEIKVPGFNFLFRETSAPILDIVDNHWDCDLLNNLAKAGSLYPFSNILSKKLYSHFKKYFINEQEYENFFNIWEHLKSLICGNNKDYLTNRLKRFIVPVGQFIFDEPRYNDDDPYSIFFESANILKNEWEPIKQGMFGGSYDQYKKIFDKAKSFYHETMPPY